MKNIKYISVLFLIIYLNLSAQNVQFTASVNSNQVAVGERVQITFSLENAQGSNFKAPTFKGFSVLMGPSQSHRTQIVNGAMSSSVGFTYLLQADQAGKFTISSATITANGKQYSSNPITITVTQGGGNTNQGQQNQSEKNMSDQAREIIKKNLFVNLSISKKDVYLGEQVIASYKLYMHPDLNLVKYDPPKLPVFNGFWTTDIEFSQKPQKEIINGVPYLAYEIKKVVLLPQQTGNVTIEPGEFDCVVRLVVQNQKQQRRSRDPFDAFFDDPFFARNQYQDFPYNAKSNSATVNVKPLPGTAPSDYNGAVGNFQLAASLTKTKVKTNEPITLKVQISGNGNLKLIQPFTLNLPPDIESFDPKTSENINVSTSGMSGNKTFEYILIPRHAGEFKIPAISFSYFDLSKKQYFTIHSQEFTINVEKGTFDESSGQVTGISKEDIKYLGKDIRFLKINLSKFSRDDSSWFNSVCFYLLNLGIIILFIAFLLFKRRQDKLYGNKALLKNKKANKMAQKRLSSAKKYMQDNNEEKFYEEVSKAIWGYLSDKLSIPYSDLTKDSATQALNQKKVTEEQIDMLITILDYCETSRFAPNAEHFNLKQVYDHSVDCISRLESEIK